MGPAQSTILVVDDDPKLAQTLREILEDEGYIVRTAYDGATTLAALQVDRPDLMLLDFQLPDMSGLELLDAARAWGLGTFPVVLLSATVRPETQLLAPEIAAFLLKPFDLDELLACVAGAIQAARQGEPPDIDGPSESAP